MAVTDAALLLEPRHQLAMPGQLVFALMRSIQYEIGLPYFFSIDGK